MPREILNSSAQILPTKVLEVVEKNDNGWWFVTLGEQTGWAPATYLGVFGTGPLVPDTLTPFRPATRTAGRPRQ